MRSEETVGTPAGVPLPSTCCIVRYRGNRGLNAVRAAIVTADVHTLDPGGVAAGAVPALDSPMHVHLWVFTPAATGPNAATGGFPEFNVPYGDGPGEWCEWSWPPRNA